MSPLLVFSRKTAYWQIDIGPCYTRACQCRLFKFDVCVCNLPKAKEARPMIRWKAVLRLWSSTSVGSREGRVPSISFAIGRPSALDGGNSPFLPINIHANRCPSMVSSGRLRSM